MQSSLVFSRVKLELVQRLTGYIHRQRFSKAPCCGGTTSLVTAYLMAHAELAGAVRPRAGRANIKRH